MTNFECQAIAPHSVFLARSLSLSLSLKLLHSTGFGPTASSLLFYCVIVWAHATSINWCNHKHHNILHRKKSPQIDMTKVHISICIWKSFQIDKEIHTFVISIWDDFFQCIYNVNIFIYESMNDWLSLTCIWSNLVFCFSIIKYQWISF